MANCFDGAPEYFEREYAFAYVLVYGLEGAVKQAIRYCIEQNLLAEYFLEREMEEVFDMVSFKWDPELAKRVQLQEAQEIGMEKGMEKGVTEIVLNMLKKKKWSLQDISEVSQWPLDKIESLGKMHQLL